MNDIDLLAALVNKDDAKFNQVIDRLRKEATDMARTILDSQDVDEATSQAVDKAIDWLKGNEPFRVSHPSAYVKRIVHNAIVDYGKTHEGKPLSDKDKKEIVIWVEGGAWDEDEEEQDVGSGEKLGWQAVKVKKTRQISVAKAWERQLAEIGIKTHHPHPWLAKINNLISRREWLTYLGWAYQHLRTEFQGTGIKITDKQAILLLKSEQDKRWQQYKLYMALIDGIPSLRDQEVMKYFLWGYRVTDIATRLDVKEPAISKVVGKWLENWGWNKAQTQKVKIILLTYNLAKVYASYYKKASTEARRQCLAQYGFEPDDDWSMGVEVILTQMMPEIHNKVIRSPETRTYFFNLKKDEDDTGDLSGTCSLCYEWWYVNPEKRYWEYMK